MKTKLLPCPFCGGDNVRFIEYKAGYGTVGCGDCCFEYPDSGFTTYPKAEAIEAWNTRHERTCHDVNLGCTFVCSECCATVQNTYVGRSYVDDSGVRWYGASNDHSFNYCPNCGAKVVGE